MLEVVLKPLLRRQQKIMRSFEGQDFYQILQISPDASLSEIKQAYRDALDMYEEDSLATLSLFSDNQRAELLKDIETAFLTLIDDEKRAVYNQMLVSTGQVDVVDLSKASQKKLATLFHSNSASKTDNLNRWVKKKSSEPEIKTVIDEITSKELVSGRDLKRLREALGIEISEIYEITKISSTNITLIEQNCLEELPAEIYLKFYLKSYAEILQIDPQRVVDGYMKYIELDKADET
jgi:curved DNA-binding protein CbpA